MTFLGVDPTQLVAEHGYWIVGVILFFESMGIPLPGESMLVAVSAYAGTRHDMSIAGVIAAAATGAILGDNAGYLLGRELGFPFLLRYGGRIGATEPRLKLGQYLFRRHGGKVVFLGRFVAFLRVLAAFLAGVNRMEWRRFLIANAAGGIGWSLVFGLGGYTLGQSIHRLSGPAALVLLALAAALALGFTLYLRGHEEELQAAAERAFPGPLRTRRGRGAEEKS